MTNQLDKNNEEISSILYHVYEKRIQNETDKQNLIKMYKFLENTYEFVDSNSNNISDILQPGTFIYYINFNNIYSTSIKFTKNGFVTSDNNEFIKITNYGKYWKIKKQNYIIFKKLSQNELMRISMLNII